jgi:hypothetical protein
VGVEGSACRVSVVWRVSLCASLRKQGVALLAALETVFAG